MMNSNFIAVLVLAILSLLSPEVRAAKDGTIILGGGGGGGGMMIAGDSIISGMGFGMPLIISGGGKKSRRIIMGKRKRRDVA